jgi:hypothetical protein
VRSRRRPAQQALAEREQRLAQLLQRRPLNAESAAAAATGIVELRAVDDEAASRFEQQLAQVLSGDLNNASDLDAGQASAAAIRAANGPLAGSQLLAALTPVTDKRIAELQAQRDAELAAQNGELVINATPWGTVDRVLGCFAQTSRIACRTHHAAAPDPCLLQLLRHS